MAYEIEQYLNVRSASAPSYSPDGQRIAFVSNLTGIPLPWVGTLRPYGYDVSSTRRDELDFIAGVLERTHEESTWEGLHAIVRRVRDETLE